MLSKHYKVESDKRADIQEQHSFVAAWCSWSLTKTDRTGPEPVLGCSRKANRERHVGDRCNWKNLREGR